MTNWTMETTNGFTQAELDVLAAAQGQLESTHPGGDSKNITDALNNAWNPGATVADLVALAGSRI